MLEIEPIPILECQRRPVVIAGPCSAETPEQLTATAVRLKDAGISILRAGIWKPRTKPGSFEGVGEEGLKWLMDIRKTLGLKIITEVATQEHVHLARSAGMDMLWIGARSTANPFTIQEIADALRGCDIPVLVKNPVSPDLELWIGALERLNLAGIRKLGAIHRGFCSYEPGVYRNPPQWDIPIELGRRIPGLPILCDPSHMGGRRELVAPLCQEAMDLGMDGLFIESHANPEAAWSDSRQQLTPEDLQAILGGLVIRRQAQTEDALSLLRNEIDQCDSQIVSLLGHRMQLSRRIGNLKKEKGLAVLQNRRYEQIIREVCRQGLAIGLSETFIRKVYTAIHEQSVKEQLRIFKTKE